MTQAEIYENRNRWYVSSYSGGVKVAVKTFTTRDKAESHAERVETFGMHNGDFTVCAIRYV